MAGRKNKKKKTNRRINFYNDQLGENVYEEYEDQLDEDDKEKNR